MVNKNTRRIVYTSLAIAIVALTTYVIKIPSPASGYVNFGDIFIFATATLIGKKTALIAGGIGSAISDLLGGYIIYSPATLVIKGLEGLICGLIVKRAVNGKINIKTLGIGAGLGAAFMVLGYFFYEWLIIGYGGALSDVPGNIIQGAVSAVVVIPIVLALNNVNISFDIERR